jgi:type II secretory pathway component GspD/PulD (secretin)
MKALAAALPEAQFSVGTDPGQLIAYARPADQAIIKAAVEQIETEGLADGRRVLSVHAMKAKDAAALVQVLDPKLLQGARVVADPNRDGLIVWAEPRQQEAIQAAVEQFIKQMPQAVEPTAQVYHFGRADPKAAQAAIAKLVPNAQIALDAINRALLVSALPEDHEKVAQAVKQLDLDTENSPKLRMYRLTTATTANLLTVLQGLFKQRTDVQVAADLKNDAIIAVATPADHETIRTLIEQVEKALPVDAQARLQLYPLKDIDSFTALEVVGKVIEKLGGKAELSLEPNSNQLVAIARPEQQAAIRETLDRLKTDERQLEIFQLENIDPNTATLAIHKLFSGDRLNAPEIDSDPSTQQLFLRGSKEQIAKIRQLLVKLGETGLAAAPSGGGPIRVVPFQGDAKGTIEELQRIWPQLRSNPLRVVPPSAISPLLRQQRGADGQPVPSEPTKLPNNPSAKPNAEPSSPPPDQPSKRGAAGQATKIRLVSWPGNATPDAAETAPPAEPKPAVSKPGAPILIAPGEGGITIASEDAEALDQFETLLRALSQRTSGPGRNLAVFSLHHTSATRVAATLQQVFRASPPGAAAGAPGGTPGGAPGATPRRSAANALVIVPDERMNAILVQANRTDRTTIENLIKVLDAAELPADAERKPRTVAIKNTTAVRVEQMIRTLFRADLTGGGSAAEAAKNPSWLATEIVLDDVTNSLIITGPTPLVEDIEQFARSIDEAAGEDTSRELVIVSLKTTNATRVQRVLDTILHQSSGTGAGRAATPSGASRVRPATPAAAPRPATPAAPSAPAAPATKKY